MPELFLFIALLLLGIAASLYFAPNLKILNFINYDSSHSVIQINRYAATRMLIPVIVSFTCFYIAENRPELTVPLIFSDIISILVAVVWIAAGVTRLPPVSE